MFMQMCPCFKDERIIHAQCDKQSCVSSGYNNLPPFKKWRCSDISHSNASFFLSLLSHLNCVSRRPEYPFCLYIQTHELVSVPWWGSWCWCYNHIQLKLTKWVERKNCVISDMRRRAERQLDHENVKSTLSRLSQFFESWLLFYIERIVSLMETIMFNSIQVINYWFILHCALRFLYQQAQISSPNIWGISD